MATADYEQTAPAMVSILESGIIADDVNASHEWQSMWNSMSVFLQLWTVRQFPWDGC